jgi:hypothetical protein
LADAHEGDGVGKVGHDVVKVWQLGSGGTFEHGHYMRWRDASFWSRSVMDGARGPSRTMTTVGSSPLSISILHFSTRPGSGTPVCAAAGRADSAAALITQLHTKGRSVFEGEKSPVVDVEAATFGAHARNQSVGAVGWTRVIGARPVKLGAQPPGNRPSRPVNAAA